MCRSVPQIDATFTFTNTSLCPNAGIFTCRISAPGAASGLTTASIVVPIIATYRVQNRTEKCIKHKTYNSNTVSSCLRRISIYLEGRNHENRRSDSRTEPDPLLVLPEVRICLCALVRLRSFSSALACFAEHRHRRLQ